MHLPPELLSTNNYIDRAFYSLQHAPIAIFGASLAMLGLALLPIQDTSFKQITILATYGGIALFILFCLTHLIRLILFTDRIFAELRNPSLMPFTAQASIALFLITEIFQSNNFLFSVELFYLSSLVASLQFILWLFNGPVKFENHKFATPAWLIPPISLLYFSFISISFGFKKLGLIIFIIGTTSILISILLLGVRIKNKSLPKTAYPGLIIFVAAMALWLLIAMNFLENTHIILSATYAINMLLFFASVLFFISISRKEFSISWWAFGMPLCASAVAQHHHLKNIGNNSFLFVCHINSIICIAITTYIFYSACRCIFKKIV